MTRWALVGVAFAVLSACPPPSSPPQLGEEQANLSSPPRISTAALSDGEVGQAYAQVLRSSGGKAPLAWTVASGALPAGLALSSAGGLAGTPSAAGSATFEVKVTDANGATDRKTLELRVLEPLAIAPGTLPEGHVAEVYVASLGASGGLAPYGWSVASGSLPPGVALDTAGALSGAPTAAGTFGVTVQVADANGETTSRAFTITVVGALVVTTTSLPDTEGGLHYAQALAAAGGTPPVRWAVTAGSLPDGLTLDPATGQIAGYPSGFGLSAFTVTATDSAASPQTASRPLQIDVIFPVSLQGPWPGDAYVGSSYAYGVHVNGGAPPFNLAVTSGALPAGLTLNAATGAITGTPAAPGTSTFNITITDALGAWNWGAYTITTYAPPAQPGSSQLGDAWVGTAFERDLPLTGGKWPYSWSVAAGALPPGLALESPYGIIIGTPTTTGISSFTIAVSDANGHTAEKAYSMEVLEPVTLLTAALPDGYVGRAYPPAVLQASGGRPPYRWTLSDAAPGLLLSGDTLTGTPLDLGPGHAVIGVSDADDFGVNRLIPLLVYPDLAITSGSLPDAYRADAYAAVVQGAGGKAPRSWSISAGSLPAGLALDPATGALSSAATGGSQTFTLTMSDANGMTTSRALGLAVYDLPAIASAGVPDADPGQPYAFTFDASGGKAPFTWSLSAGSVPPGLSLSPAGALTGSVPLGTTPGAYAFTLTVSDANGKTGSAPFSLFVRGGLQINTASLTTATEGVTYLRAPGTPEQVIAGGGTPPYALSATALPPGLAFDPATGVISGLPAQGTAGTYLVTFTVTDAASASANRTLPLVVELPQPLYGGGTVSTAPAGSPITQVLTVFTQDFSGHPRGDVAVRLRKNGVEYSPAREQVTDPVTGKTVFAGLGLNGTTDTVDVTVNGANVVNASWLRVNAAVVTVALRDYPVPFPRAYANGEIDPASGQLIVTQGLDPNQWVGETPVLNGSGAASLNDLLRLTDAAAGTWVEDLQPGMTSAPAGRWGAAMAYSAGAAAHVLFGGYDASGAALRDLWYYRPGPGWSAHGANGDTPSARAQMACGTLASGAVAFFGGNASPWAPAPLDDLFLYAPATSTFTRKTPSPSPAARYNAGAAAIGGALWVCGGSDGAAELSDCWSYDVVADAWTARPPIPTGGRQGHAMVADGAGRLYVFGGQSFGVSLDDLLVFDGAAWSSPPQANVPPAREGAVLAVDPATGDLLLYGGRNSTGRYFSDLWSYDPSTGTWTQRAPSFWQPATGFTIRGAISNGAGGFQSRVIVEASGRSGYTNRQIIQLSNGSAAYAMSDIPPGDTVSLTVLNEDLGQPYASREWSWVDLGVVATGIGGDITRDIALPAGPMSSQLQTVTGSYQLPPDTVGTWFAAALARMTRPGFANHPNGSNRVDTAARTFRADYFPPAPGTSETIIAEELSTTAACEQVDVFLPGVAPGPLPLVAFPAGPRALSPGLSGCARVGSGLQDNGTLFIPSPIRPLGIAVADLSGDGVPDLAVLGDQVYVYFGSSAGDAAFPPDANLVLPLPLNDALAFDIADVDGDGRQDVVVSLQSGWMLAFLQTAPGAFTQAQTRLVSGGYADRISLGDVNGDGHVDIVFRASFNGFGLGWMLGLGDGTFSQEAFPPYVGSMRYLGPVVDLDGDGRGDLAAAIWSENGIRLYRGGPAGLEDVGARATPWRIERTAVGDLDGDGRPDLAVMEGNAFEILRNEGAFTFTTVSSQPMPVAQSLAVAEVTGDAFPDVVMVWSGRLRVFPGDGAGAIGSASEVMLPGSTNDDQLAVADLDSDGHADVATGEYFQAVQTLLSRAPIPAGTDRYSFVAPPASRVMNLFRGPADYAYDFEVFAPATSGMNAVSLPQVSGLRPSRPAPAGQTVMWAPGVFLSTDPAALSINDFRPNPRTMDAESFTLRPSKYRR